MGKTAVAIDLTDSERREAWRRGVGQRRVGPTGADRFAGGGRRGK
jgi:hypothetical protein